MGPMWFDDLRDGRGKAKIHARIERLRHGNLGDSKSLGGELYELRIHFGPGYRVYFGRDGKTLVLLLCGGDKGSQKEDIGKARQYWADYKGGRYEKE
jgi:putative addiction module killer protein